VAFYPISATRAYTVYATSATPSLTGYNAYTVTTPGVQTLVVSAARPLILFNLNVSLEWDARQDQQYMSQLQYDLRRASEFLFDWTNGRAALGMVTFYHDRVNWDAADVRIYASNRLRPWAVQGGIAEVKTTDPTTGTLAYEPGMVHMAATWNRYGDPGVLGEDWPRTLAHELGHYALFLDDNYLGLDAAGFLIPVTTCPGAMSDPFRDDWSELHPEAGWSQECGTTLAARAAGADWRTVHTFYPWLPNVLTNTNSGPVNLPLNVTQLRVAAPVTATQALDDPRFYLRDVNGASVQPGVGARAFLYGQDLAGQRLIDLGRPTQDTVWPVGRGRATGVRVRADGGAAAGRSCRA
jgi:hypothetical protein